MKYIYILGLITIVIICLLINKQGKFENFTIPVKYYADYGEPKNTDYYISKEPPPNDTTDSKVKRTFDGGTLPQTGIVVDNKIHEMKPQIFEEEEKKCSEVKFCENLTENLNCGYCLQDDLEGKHPFHFGDKDGPHLNKGSNTQSLCKKGINRDGKTEWISPAYLNGKKKNELEKELENLIKVYPHRDDPRRQKDEIRIRNEIETMGIEDTGYSGCMKMRERYICSKVNDCSPMTFKMFGIKAKDICGYCADTGNAMVRQDVPADVNKHKITRVEYVTNPKCENIEIFGDGVNCSTYNKNKSGCLAQKSLEDASLHACAYNYHGKRQTRHIKVPKPSIPKYGQHEKTRIYDKCDSEWGLIRPSQCDWFEEAYPCLKSKTGGPHDPKCLQSLWNQMGFQTHYTKLLSNDEKKLVDLWQRIDVDSVLASMESLYEKVYSQNYEVAKKWAKICFGLDVNMCNRAGFITSKYPSQYWKETSDPCMSLLYRYGGGQRKGLANPKNTNKMSFGYLGSTKTPTDIDTNPGLRELTKTYPHKFRANESELERLGGSFSHYWAKPRTAKSLRQRDYINKIKELNKVKDMPNSKAKQVRTTNQWRGVSEDKFSNARWVDKLISNKMITGNTPDFPVGKNKPCWPDYARRMLSHPQVKLLNLKTLSFQSANEFHNLSHYGGNNIVYENLRRSGNRFFDGGHKRLITKDTYEQDTFPYWKWLDVNEEYWRNKWGIFYKKVLDYAGSKGSSYQDVMRPTNEDTAKQIARAHGYRIGGHGYTFGGNYGRKGLYVYDSGRYRNSAYFGRYGSSYQMKSGGLRIDKNANYQVIVFTPESRFYNVLPDTYSMSQALNNHKFLVMTDSGRTYKYLFQNSYFKKGFPYHKFFNVMSKN